MTNRQKSNGGRPLSDQPSDLRQAPTPENLEELFAAGEEAARVLGSTLYNAAYQKVVNGYLEQWMATDPQEFKTREFLYAKVSAASDHVKEMHTALVRAQSEHQAAQQRDEADQRARAEGAGYL